jgi:dTDP-4-amino-4,6-dideoxygalactose transaminase
MHPKDIELLRFTYYRGRVALAAILRALKVGRGDNVAIQAFTCLAVPEAILSVGARPLYIDVEAEGVTMDPADLAQRLSGDVKAIVVQHTYGVPTDMDRIMEVADFRRIPVVEDCAHAIGSTWNGQQLGSRGVAAFYSYEASKPIVIGMGGSAVTNDLELARSLESDYVKYSEPSGIVQLQLLGLRAAGRLLYRPDTYWMVRKGFRALSRVGAIPGSYNDVTFDSVPAKDFQLRMGGSQRALLRRALRSMARSTEQRRAIGDVLLEGVTAGRVRLLAINPAASPVFARVPFLAESRSSLLEAATRSSVEVTDFYNSPVHPLQGESLRKVGYQPGSRPNAEWISARIITVPTNRYMTGRILDRVLRVLNGRGGRQSA